jgi:hypothetical protein
MFFNKRYSGYQIRRISWTWLVTCMREMRSCQDFGRSPEGCRILERRRCRWKDDIKMDVKSTGWEKWSRLFCLRVGIILGCCK